MTDSIRECVLGLIEKKDRLPKNADIDSFNYIDTGYVDSIGIIKFLVEIENNYNIEITEADIESADFKTVGGLVSIIKNKLASR